MDKVCNTTFTLLNVVLVLVFSVFVWGMAPLVIFALAATGLMLAMLVCLFFEAGFGICIPTRIANLFKRA